MDYQQERVLHDQSVQDYPEIDLRDDEYVVIHMRRSHFGIVAIWATTALCIVGLTIALAMLSNADFVNNNLLNINAAAKSYLSLFVVMLYVLFVATGFMSQTIYKANQMWVTNHRVIQKIRTSLFGNSTQVIELVKVEDVSYRQNGIFENIFHLGTLRISTVGDETTYTFPMLDTPRDEIETISELAFESRRRKHAANQAKTDAPKAKTPEVKPEVLSEQSEAKLSEAEQKAKKLAEARALVAAADAEAKAQQEAADRLEAERIQAAEQAKLKEAQAAELARQAESEAAARRLAEELRADHESSDDEEALEIAAAEQAIDSAEEMLERHKDLSTRAQRSLSTKKLAKARSSKSHVGTNTATTKLSATAKTPKATKPNKSSAKNTHAKKTKAQQILESDHPTMPSPILDNILAKEALDEGTQEESDAFDVASMT